MPSSISYFYNPSSMTLRSYGSVLLFCVAVFSTACAQTKAVVKSGTTLARVTRATSERFLPGREESDPITRYRISLQWRSSSKPVAFYWRPQDGWMNCLVVKPGGSDEEISPESIRKMQSVELVPMADASRTPVPAFVKATDKNKLYFQVGKIWYSLPVTLTKKQDVVAP